MLRSYSLIFAFVFLVAFSGCASDGAGQPTFTGTENGARTRSVESRIVEAGCATCIFDMPGVDGCPLAVKIDDEFYLVVGSDIDAHGDAHAPSGLCMTARKAKTTGRIEGDKFVATSFALQP